jgi:AcrR family transcriptional regulator
MTAPRDEVEQIQRSLRLLWGTGDRPTRGPRPKLTLDRIVTAAITVADTGGIEELSMRRVAAELGVGTMSLYRYVPGKVELLALMMDRVNDLGLTSEQLAGKSWREVLERMARASYRAYLDHPWVLQVNWTRQVLGPTAVARLELAVGALADCGLTDPERIAVVDLLEGYVSGLARQRVYYQTASERSGLTHEQFWAAQYPTLAAAMTSGRYPAMADLSEDAFGFTWEQSFEFGLARLLDGVGLLIGSRQRRAGG